MWQHLLVETETEEEHDDIVEEILKGCQKMIYL